MSAVFSGYPRNIYLFLSYKKDIRCNGAETISTLMDCWRVLGIKRLKIQWQWRDWESPAKALQNVDLVSDEDRSFRYPVLVKIYRDLSATFFPGVLPYTSHIDICRPKGCGFWAFLVWKRVYTLPILVWNRVWFSRELLECMNVFVVSIPYE